MDRETEEALAAAVEYEEVDEEVDSDATPPRASSSPPLQKRKKRKATKKAKVYTTADAVDDSDNENEPGFDDLADDDEFGSQSLLEQSDDSESDRSEDTADEDLGGDPEATRETAKLVSAAAAAEDTVELTMPSAANPVEIPVTHVLYTGDAQQMKPSSVIKDLVPGQLAHIQVADEEFVHAVAIINPKTSVVSFRGLTYAEEQTVLRNGLSDAFPKKIDYAALVKEQLRWDDMSDSDTLTAAVASKWAGFFRTHTLHGMDRKRAFILSTDFVKERAERLAKAAERRSAPKSSPDVLTQADPKPLKVTAGRSFKEGDKKQTTIHQRMLIKKVKERAPKPKSEPEAAAAAAPSKPAFSFASPKKAAAAPAPAAVKPKKKKSPAMIVESDDDDVMEVEQSKKKPAAAAPSPVKPSKMKRKRTKEDDATPDRPIQTSTPNAPKRLRADGDGVRARALEIHEAFGEAAAADDTGDYCYVIYKKRVEGKDKLSKLFKLLGDDVQ